jgi:malonate-semialdehyde dehydrogenase (acetylating)/methylmalonate-semialdehyde dehydrogenase
MIVQNWIGGIWKRSRSTETIQVLNPATQEILAHTPLGTETDVEEAVAAAQTAFVSWRKTPAVERVQYLFRFKTLLEAHQEEISRIITQEHGKTLIESRGSVRRAIQMVETACGIPSLLQGESSEDIAAGIDSISIRRPMGVFAGIAPFNFPAMVPFWFWPFAIACGNTYVLKASERVPLTSVKIFALLEQTGLPAGVMNLLQGGKTVVNALCQHPQVKGISFVGSTPIAKHVYTLGCANGKRVQALGGAKNVMVVLPDSLQTDTWKKRTLRTAVESVIGCAGERCLAGSVILCVGDKTYQEFQEGAISLAKQIRVGNGLEATTDMGPVISEAAKEGICALISRAVGEGARLLFDGREGVEDMPGYFLRPTVLADIQSHMEIAQKEVFGPVLLLGKVDSLEAAISWINHIPYANTSTLFTASGASARKFAYEVDPSMIGINIGVPAPMAFFSFGGSKESFFGDLKAHGKQSIHFFTDTYTTMYRWYDSEASVWGS